MFKGNKKTLAQIRYNVSKKLLRKTGDKVKGDVVALTLTLSQLKKECIKVSKMTKTKKSKSSSKTSNFGNKKRMEKYLLKLLRPN